MRYFRVDDQRVVHFENTADLGREINSAIEALRQRANAIHPRFGAYVKKKTPGPTKVKLGVKMALENNGFDLKSQQFVYQGRVGVVTKRINSRLNRKLRGLRPDDLDFVESAVAGIFDRALAGQPTQGVGPLSAALAHAVVSAARQSDTPAEPKRPFAALEQQVRLTLQNTKSAAANLNGLVEIDADRHLLLFRDTDSLAAGINGLIRDIRGIANAVPAIGGQLSQYVAKKTPGPNLVNQAVRQLLRNNAFDYENIEFVSQGRSLGTTKVVNYFANKQLAPHREKLMSVSELTQLAVQAYIADRHLRELQADARQAVAELLSTQILGLAGSVDGAE